MVRNLLIIACFLFLSESSFSQSKDSLQGKVDDELLLDTSINYDDLLNELDLFLDSLLKPRSFFLASVSAGSNYANFWRRNFTRLEPVRKFFYTPVIGYYHRSGPGLTISGNITDDEKNLNLFQFAITPSFDFTRNMDWAAGISYTRYFTKDSLPFYTSPLQNEYNAYFVWRRSWLQPGISVTYGHGSRKEFKERERYIDFLRRRGRRVFFGGVTTVEKVADFFASASVRHTFYFRRLLGDKDYIKFGPQLSFSAGTQQFGFNRTASIYTPNQRNAGNLSFTTTDVAVDDNLRFQPLAVTLYLRPEYSIGVFFIQPQFLLDYYFPSEKLSAIFSVNAGVVF